MRGSRRTHHEGEGLGAWWGASSQSTPLSGFRSGQTSLCPNSIPNSDSTRYQDSKGPGLSLSRGRTLVSLACVFWRSPQRSCRRRTNARNPVSVPKRDQGDMGRGQYQLAMRRPNKKSPGRRSRGEVGPSALEIRQRSRRNTMFCEARNEPLQLCTGWRRRDLRMGGAGKPSSGGALASKSRRNRWG